MLSATKRRRLVAEGVEKELSLESLPEAAVMEFQGYLFSRLFLESQVDDVLDF